MKDLALFASPEGRAVLPQTDLASMSLADCPDLGTAVAAGIAHGLTPKEAVKSAFMKWMQENSVGVQGYGLANFYDGPESPRAMVNYSALTQFLAITVAEQQRAIESLTREIVAIRAVVPYLPPSGD